MVHVRPSDDHATVALGGKDSGLLQIGPQGGPGVPVFRQAEPLFARHRSIHHHELAVDQGCRVIYLGKERMKAGPLVISRPEEITD